MTIADARGGEARYYEEIEHMPEAVRKLMRKLGKAEQLVTCYEAVLTGYRLYRLLKEKGIRCMVVTPTLIPVCVWQARTNENGTVRMGIHPGV